MEPADISCFADRALYLFETTTYSYRKCAKKADRKVKIDIISPKLVTYEFSDGSKRVTTGRTVDFQIQIMDEPELQSLIAIEKLFSDIRRTKLI